MADFIIQQMELPLHFGFSTPRWANAFQTMLPKDPGTLKLNRRRVIQLFEADYNFVLIIIWGRSMVWSGKYSGSTFQLRERNQVTYK